MFNNSNKRHQLSLNIDLTEKNYLLAQPINDPMDG